MVTADPQRTPTFTLFANPDFFITTSNQVRRPAQLRRHHGPDAPSTTTSRGITAMRPTTSRRTWLGMVGPGSYESRRDEQGVVGSHRHPADDARSRGPEGHVRARRSRDRPSSHRLRRFRRLERKHRADSAAARARLQGAKRAVRRNSRFRRPLRFDEGNRERELDRRRHLHVARGISRRSDRPARHAGVADARALNNAALGPSATPRSTSTQAKSLLSQAEAQLDAAARRSPNVSRVTSARVSSRHSPGRALQASGPRSGSGGGS